MIILEQDDVNAALSACTLMAPFDVVLAANPKEGTPKGILARVAVIPDLRMENISPFSGEGFQTQVILCEIWDRLEVQSQFGNGLSTDAWILGPKLSINKPEEKTSTWPKLMLINPTLPGKESFWTEVLAEFTRVLESNKKGLLREMGFDDRFADEISFRSLNTAEPLIPLLGDSTGTSSEEVQGSEETYSAGDPDIFQVSHIRLRQEDVKETKVPGLENIMHPDDVVSPRGGLTFARSVEVYDDRLLSARTDWPEIKNGQEWVQVHISVGVSVCSLEDNFIRVKGNSIACSRSTKLLYGGFSASSTKVEVKGGHPGTLFDGIDVPLLELRSFFHLQKSALLRNWEEAANTGPMGVEICCYYPKQQWASLSTVARELFIDSMAARASRDWCMRQVEETLQVNAALDDNVSMAVEKDKMFHNVPLLMYGAKVLSKITAQRMARGVDTLVRQVLPKLEGAGKATFGEALKTAGIKLDDWRVPPEKGLDKVSEPSTSPKGPTLALTGLLAKTLSSKTAAAAMDKLSRFRLR